MRRALPLLLLLVACSRDRPAPAPPPPPAVPAPPPPAPPVEEPAPAADGDREYQGALVEHDRQHLAFFDEALAAVTAALARYDAIEAGAAKGAEAKARAALEAAVREHGKKLAAIERRNDALDGSRSGAVPELHVLLYEARTGYPDAVRQRLAGRAWVLDEKRAAVSDRRAELGKWLAQVRAAGR